MEEKKRNTTRKLASKYLSNDNPTGWFEALYKSAKHNSDKIPWADLTPNPNLVEFMNQNQINPPNKKALVIGCGLGDDSEYLSSLGFAVDSFDISPTAIDWCKTRFSDTKVHYFVADILKFSGKNTYDFILESYTIQVLPSELHLQCIENISKLLNEKGLLLIIARGRDENDDPGKMPWPLTKNEIIMYENYNMKIIRFEDYLDKEDPPVRRFRVLFESTI